MTEVNDQQLLQLIAGKDNPALRELYRRHSARVYNTALVYLQEQVDAEEVTQDVFTKVWRSAAKFKGKSQVSTWIYRIAVNTSLTQLDKRKRKAVVGLGELSSKATAFVHPETPLEKREEQRMLYAAIYQLPSRQKTAFVLSYVEQLPRQQVADIMGVSLKSIESLLMRAKRGLKTELKSKFPNRGIN